MLIRASIVVACVALLCGWQREPRVIGPFSIATNIPYDAMGTPDTRPNTWGDAGYQMTPIHFTEVPAGYRVRILRVYGDFISWPRGVVEPGEFAGTLWGLQTTAPDGSTRADLAADNCMAYLQQGIGAAPVRAAYDLDTAAGGLLGFDSTLNVKEAVFLNTTGLVIHSEASFTIVYDYEREE